MESRIMCYACDLKDEEEAIQKYKEYHLSENAWPEIITSIKEAGVLDMQIYITGNRLFMIIAVADDFSEIRKAAMDSQNSKVQEWETLMSTFQRVVPWGDPKVKWTKMERIFKL